MVLLNPAIAGTGPRTRTAQNAETVVTCYSVLDRFFPACGFFDLTEGVYDHDAHVRFEDAQSRQLNYLLDEAACGPGTRILDVGCGYGHLLEEAHRRGAAAVGITISPEQAAFCRERGLDVHLLNYRAIDENWDGQFDCVIANGSTEHFVQAGDAVAGKDDGIYRELFGTVRRLIDPQSPAGRFVTAAIHFARPPDPHDVVRSPFAFVWGSEEFHFALLARCFGGWYPAIGQFERCANGLFDLARTDDGTEDLCRTSEEWLGRVRGMLATPKGAQIFRDALPVFARHPVQFSTMLLCMLGTESWNWQFRGNDPPTRLLRQTWQCGEHSSDDASTASL